MDDLNLKTITVAIMTNKKPANTKAPDTDSCHSIGTNLKKRLPAKIKIPKRTNPFGIIKWSMSTKVTEISK